MSSVDIEIQELGSRATITEHEIARGPELAAGAALAAAALYGVVAVRNYMEV